MVFAGFTNPLVWVKVSLVRGDITPTPATATPILTPNCGCCQWNVTFVTALDSYFSQPLVAELYAVSLLTDRSDS